MLDCGINSKYGRRPLSRIWANPDPFHPNLLDHEMPRVCELTNKKVMTGNNVSHANNKTKRRFLPNLNAASLMSDTLGKTFQLRVSASALRTVDHRGGLDKFLDSASDSELSPRALKIKKAIAKARSEAKLETPAES